ncbi:hypothetical protein AB7828_10060 [Tardiphaga sp. 215_C5_N2_1]|uniref:hypothetical protein n=1 Tax=Tardiphaga sp. 215_C5_N2_1 TaxID=3240774 RepID=UPI003F8B9F8E
MNQKTDCTKSLSAHLRRTASWRRSIAAKYPGDPRNVRAAEALDGLATAVMDLSDAEWCRLKEHYSWASEKWAVAVNDASRLVGFQPNTTTVAGLVATIAGLLRVEVAA